MADVLPRTSNRQVAELFESLDLDFELDLTASPALDVALEQAVAWYTNPARAAAAQVVALPHAEGASNDAILESPAFAHCRMVFSQWVGRSLAAVADHGLEQFVADVLLIASKHTAAPENANQLLVFETRVGVLFLLRPEKDRRGVEGEGYLPATWYSAETEAALNGVYRDEGCSEAFADHLPQCRLCSAGVRRWDERFGLPKSWEAVRTWNRPDVTPTAPSLPPLPPASGVAIVIPRTKPWGTF